jgi:hypothetical protein
MLPPGCGKEHSRVKSERSPTISDAAAQFGVSTSTVRKWIEQGVIPTPPHEPHGRASLSIFPQDYMDRARTALERSRAAATERKHRERAEARRLLDKIDRDLSELEARANRLLQDHAA